MDEWVVALDDVEGLVPPAATPLLRTTEMVTAIYDRYQREIFSFALRASRDRQTAEDVVHEAFVRLIVEVDADRAPRNLRAWLYRVVANLLISQGRHETVANRELGTLVDRGEAAGPESVYLDRERDAHLDLVLGELGSDARTALLMAADGFNGMEIAEAIGRSGSATRTLMCRSRVHLRRRLDAIEALG
jgi:RNA polymerase sigma factor (sigma-70 family)